MDGAGFKTNLGTINRDINRVIHINFHTMNATQFFSTYSLDQIRAGFIRYISNQRKCDKYSIGYMLHIINHYKYMACSQFPEDFKRGDLLASLIGEIQDEKNIRICIHSDYTVGKVLWEIEEIEIDKAKIANPPRMSARWQSDPAVLAHFDVENI